MGLLCTSAFSAVVLPCTSSSLATGHSLALALSWALYGWYWPLGTPMALPLAWSTITKHLLRAPALAMQLPCALVRAIQRCPALQLQPHCPEGSCCC